MHKIFGMMLLIPILAIAQVQPFSMDVLCGPTKLIFSDLKKYNEKVTWAGKEADNTIVSVWQNMEKQTFSVLKTSANGAVTCLISSGKIFTPV
jgi:hypothetical protein